MIFSSQEFYRRLTDIWLFDSAPLHLLIFSGEMVWVVMITEGNKKKAGPIPPCLRSKRW